ncbi:MAG: hypothetical protein PVJ27_01385 [Candidatus Brocadiaceae bacterium]
MSRAERSSRLEEVRSERSIQRHLACALLLALLPVTGCSTEDPDAARAKLQQHFHRDVPPGYECKYAFSLSSARGKTSLAIVAPEDVRLDQLDSALRHKTVLLFQEASTYTVPWEEDDAGIEAVLWHRLTSEGHGIRLGQEVASKDESISVGGQQVEAKKVLTVREDGTRLVRYRAPIGYEQILVAIGPDSALDRDAIAGLRPPPPPEKWQQWLGGGILAVAVLVAVLSYVGSRKKGAR